MKKFVNFRFVVTLVLAVFANVVTYAPVSYTHLDVYKRQVKNSVN